MACQEQIGHSLFNIHKEVQPNSCENATPGIGPKSIAGKDLDHSRYLTMACQEKTEIPWSQAKHQKGPTPIAVKDLRLITQKHQKGAKRGPKINGKQFKNRISRKVAHLIHILAKHPIYQRKTIDSWHICTIELLRTRQRSSIN